MLIIIIIKWKTANQIHLKYYWVQVNRNLLKWKKTFLPKWNLNNQFQNQKSRLRFQILQLKKFMIKISRKWYLQLSSTKDNKNKLNKKRQVMKKIKIPPSSREFVNFLWLLKMSLRCRSNVAKMLPAFFLVFPKRFEQMVGF